MTYIIPPNNNNTAEFYYYIKDNSHKLIIYYNINYYYMSVSIIMNDLSSADDVAKRLYNIYICALRFSRLNKNWSNIISKKQNLSLQLVNCDYEAICLIVLDSFRADSCVWGNHMTNRKVRKRRGVNFLSFVTSPEKSQTVQLGRRGYGVFNRLYEGEAHVEENRALPAKIAAKKKASSGYFLTRNLQSAKVRRGLLWLFCQKPYKSKAMENGI